MKNFREWMEERIAEATLGFDPAVASHVDTIMKRIEEKCDKDWWARGKAGLSEESMDEMFRTREGIAVHDFEEPMPNLKVVLQPRLPKGVQGHYLWEPIEELKGKGVVEIKVLPAAVPKRLKWMEGPMTKWLLDLTRTAALENVEDLRRTLEHELVHAIDPSIKAQRNARRNSDHQIDSSYKVGPRGYMTGGGEGAGMIPDEFYPRVWTILRACRTEEDRRELEAWIRRPTPQIPRCMEGELEFVNQTVQDPSLRALLQRKLWDGLRGRFSRGQDGPLARKGK